VQTFTRKVLNVEKKGNVVLRCRAAALLELCEVARSTEMLRRRATCITSTLTIVVNARCEVRKAKFNPGGFHYVQGFHYSPRL